MAPFTPNGLPLLIGSLPLNDHAGALDLVFDHTPDIPLWVQLPGFREEGMIRQFLPGMPGLSEKNDTWFIDTRHSQFDEDFIRFFEEYLSLSEPGADFRSSRFAFTALTGKGFFHFLDRVDRYPGSFAALKGQITGPVTFCTAVKDEAGKDIFYNDPLRDAAVKRLAMNARWQAKEFAGRGAVPILFLDEPALAGFGTSAYITITRADVQTCIEEIVQEIHAEKGLAGVHVCANTEWDLLLDTSIDIISFDAFSYFDKFILYPRAIKEFLGRGGILAWGIVPTGDADLISQQTREQLTQKLADQIRQVSGLGISREKIMAQSLVTPSCGTGSLDPASATRVLKLTKTVSEKIRAW
jgi:methionine synthase II (cobalamin-independent)